MKNTIEAKDGYKVRFYNGKATGKQCCKVYDGENLLFWAYVRTKEDYKDEQEQNECFVKYEVFETVDGKQFIYWGDCETMFDYITPVKA